MDLYVGEAPFALQIPEKISHAFNGLHCFTNPLWQITQVLKIANTTDYVDLK